MEKFIDCVIYGLMNYSVSCRKLKVAGKAVWVMTFENMVTLTFDEEDVYIVREVYEGRKLSLDAEENKRYQHFLSLCQ